MQQRCTNHFSKSNIFSLNIRLTRNSVINTSPLTLSLVETGANLDTTTSTLVMYGCCATMIRINGDTRLKSARRAVA